MEKLNHIKKGTKIAAETLVIMGLWCQTVWYLVFSVVILWIIQEYIPLDQQTAYGVSFVALVSIFTKMFLMMRKIIIYRGKPERCEV